MMQDISTDKQWSFRLFSSLKKLLIRVSLYITIFDISTSKNGPWLNLEEIKNKVLEEINHGWIGWNLDLHGDMVYLVFDCDKKVIGCDFSDLDDEIARIILKQNFVETFKVADKVFQALSAAVKGY